MKMNTLQTAKNLAENVSQDGATRGELWWLYFEGFKGFNNMTDKEIKDFITSDYALHNESFPNVIVYDKESQ